MIKTAGDIFGKFEQYVRRHFQDNARLEIKQLPPNKLRYSVQVTDNRASSGSLGRTWAQKLERVLSNYLRHPFLLNVQVEHLRDDQYQVVLLVKDPNKSASSKELIKLAYENPELRTELLPVINKCSYHYYIGFTWTTHISSEDEAKAILKKHWKLSPGWWSHKDVQTHPQGKLSVHVLESRSEKKKYFRMEFNNREFAEEVHQKLKKYRLGYVDRVSEY